MNLAAYRTAIAIKLDDTGNTRFSTTQIDDALRGALIEYSRLVPIERTYILDTTGKARMSLPVDFIAAAITKAEYEPNSTDYTYKSSVPFRAAFEDEGWWVEVYETDGDLIPADQVISLTYAMLHQIDGLNGAAGTTVYPRHEQYLVMGAAGYALLSRATSRIEAINLNPEVAAEMRQQANAYLSEFRNGVNRAAKFTRSDPTYQEPRGY